MDPCIRIPSGKKIELSHGVSVAEPEWPKALQNCAAARTIMGLNPHQCLLTHDLQARDMDHKGSTAMLTSIQSADITSGVNLRIAHKQSIHPGLKASADVTRSPKQKGLVSSKKKKEKKSAIDL